MIAVLGAAIAASLTLALRPWLFAICQDEEYARVAGLPVRALNLLLAVTTAVTVTVAMRAVGLLLVSALMVVPVAAAQLVTRGFRSTMTAAMALGLVAAGAGRLGGRPTARHRARAPRSCWWRSPRSWWSRAGRRRLAGAAPAAGARPAAPAREPPDVVLR